jgi:hypothetical protein
LAKALKGDPDTFANEAVKRLEAAGLLVADKVIAEVLKRLKMGT